MLRLESAGARRAALLDAVLGESKERALQRAEDATIDAMERAYRED